MRAVTLALCALVLVPALSAKTRKDIPPAPLPEAVINAQKIFLSNGGGSDLAYDAFYEAMKKWGKYQIVGSPDKADLIVELAYKVENLGTHVWSATNTYTNATQVYSRHKIKKLFVGND